MNARTAPVRVVVISPFPAGHPLAAQEALASIQARLSVSPVSRVAGHTLGRLAHGSIELDALVDAMGGH